MLPNGTQTLWSIRLLIQELDFGERPEAFGACINRAIPKHCTEVVSHLLQRNLAPSQPKNVTASFCTRSPASWRPAFQIVYPMDQIRGTGEVPAHDATPWTVTRCSEALNESRKLLDHMREWHTHLLQGQNLIKPHSDADDRTFFTKEQAQGSQSESSKHSGLAGGEKYSTDPVWASSERKLQKRNKNRYGVNRRILPDTPGRRRHAI